MGRTGDKRVDKAMELLLAKPDGMTPIQLVRSLLSVKSTPAPIAEKLAAAILGCHEEFEFDGKRWRLASTTEGAALLVDTPFVVVDVETTGGQPSTNRVIEVGAVRIHRGSIVDRFTTLINPRRMIPLQISYLTGIYNEHVAGAPFAEDVMPDFLEFIGGDVFVAHPAPFDFAFMNCELDRCGATPMRNKTLCTVKLARRALPGEPSYSLDHLIPRLDLKLDATDRHRAYGDAWATALMLMQCLDILQAAGVNTLEELLAVNAMPLAKARKRLVAIHGGV